MTNSKQLRDPLLGPDPPLEKRWSKSNAKLSWRPPLEKLPRLHLQQHWVPFVQGESARYAHNIEPLEKQVISQEDVGLQQVLVVRVYPSSDSAVWGGTEQIRHIKTGWIRLDDKQMFGFHPLIPSPHQQEGHSAIHRPHTATLSHHHHWLTSFFTLSAIDPPHILPLRTHSPEWMLMVVPTRLLFRCLFSHRKSMARRAWFCA